MLRSYIKIAFRNLWKHKLFSFINIFGLAVGMAVSILALIDLKSAYDYDLFHPYPERTYRIISDYTGKNNEKRSWASTPARVAGALRKYTFAEECVQVYPGRLQVSAGSEMLDMEANFVDAGFFKIFGFKMRQGNFDPSPYRIVLSMEMAKRFFGKKDPVGKTLKLKDGSAFTVTGILAEPEGKSHLGYGALISSTTLPLLSEFKNIIDDQTNPAACYTYVLLKTGVTETVFSRVLPVIGRQATRTIPAESDLRSIGFRWQLLEKINPDREGLMRTTGGGGGGAEMNKIMVQIAIGLVTLLLAAFNYVNLTLARSLTRSREVGVRKVIGARKTQLITQFVTESLILSLFALALSCWMVKLMEPLNVVANILKDVRWDLRLWGILLSFTLLAGFLAGIIPAKLLASFSPVTALKAQHRRVIFKGLTLRKVLVVVQFAISITGIFFMLIMYNQQKFMAEGEYGFNRDNILNINLSDRDHRIITAAVITQPGVERVTATSGLMGMQYTDVVKLKTADKQHSTLTGVQSADVNFVQVMGLQLVAGKNPPSETSDSAGNMVLLNEKAIQDLRFVSAGDAVGQLIWMNDSTQVRVAGVIKDFHYLSMAHPILPLMIRYEPAKLRLLQVKVTASVLQDKFKADISRRLSKLIKPSEQDISWFDQQLYDQHFHGNDQLFMGVLTGMILSIACLGLLGMVTYTSETRTKEVGIRKVMGASVSQVVFLLSRDFIWLLAIAALIAFPSGIISGIYFLNNFAFHITIGAGTICSAFFALLFIGVITIGLQTRRIAAGNPVETLRSE